MTTIPDHPNPERSSSAEREPDRERVVRVFISSTFKDMVADRDVLMIRTWPALRQLCRERAVEFVEVDLRWGITEEQSRRKETVQVCLDEIQRCRPYFIGLLGERYGWVPEAEAFPEGLLEREGWLIPEIARRSATELEILHGVLNNPEMAGRAFFYFRDPAYAERLAATGQTELTEHADPKDVERFGEAEAARRAEVRRARLADLKARIRTLCETRGMPLREADRYTDPTALAALVLADLTAAIDAEFPPDRVPDVWAREARDHAAYAQSRCGPAYLGREADLARLEAYARDGADGGGFAVLGESGVGKSALLAHWLARWRAAHPDAFVFQHYIGSSPMSAGHLALLRRLMVAILRWCDDAAGGDEESRLPAQGEELIKVFPEFLGRLAYTARQRGVGAVLVLDALNQLDDQEQGRRLAWLPWRLPLELRLIVSTLPGDTDAALAPRAWPVLRVAPLTPGERQDLIARYLNHVGRGLSAARIETIAAAPAAANPLYLKTLLDELRVIGAHRALDAQIAAYLAAPDIPALLATILARYERDYERDRPALVRDALSLLWAARRGLSEPELLRLIEPPARPQLPAALWAPLRAVLADALIDRGGLLGFGHEHLRQAVAQRYLPDRAAQEAPRRRLADYFEAAPVSARSCDELPWLLEQTCQLRRLRACLLDIERFGLIRERDQHELLGYWVRLGEARSMGEPYLASFARWAAAPGIADDPLEIAPRAHALGDFLRVAGLFSAAEPLLRQALGACEEGLGRTHPKTLQFLNNLAVVLRYTGDLVGAEVAYRQALQGLERTLGPAHPDTLQSVNNLAALLYAKGDLTAAEPLYRRALSDSEEALGPLHPQTLASVHNLAYLLRSRGDLVSAERLARRALMGRDQVLGPSHPSTLRSVDNLAAVLHKRGDFIGAEPLFRRAIAGFEQTLGPAHPSTLISVNNLAELLRSKGDLAAAEPLYREALAKSEETFGPARADSLVILANLAQLLLNKGDFAAADQLARQALAGHEEALGSEHPDTLTSLHNLAMVLQETGDLSGAEPLYRRALAGYEKVLGSAHPRTLASLHNLAVLLRDRGDLVEAEPLARRAVAGYEQAFGTTHPDTLLSVRSLAELLQRKGDLAEAEALYRRVLSGLATISPDGQRAHPDLLTCVARYVGLLEHRGINSLDIRARLQALDPDRFGRPSLPSVRAESPPDPTPRALRARAVELAAQGEYTRAKALFERLLALDFEVPETRVQLACIALLKDAVLQAEAQLAQAWEERSAAPPDLIPRILWLQLALAMLAEASSGTRSAVRPFLLGCLKTALSVAGAHRAWSMVPVLTHLKARVSAPDHALLTALVAASSDFHQRAALDALPAWRAAMPWPLE